MCHHQRYTYLRLWTFAFLHIFLQTEQCCLMGWRHGTFSLKPLLSNLWEKTTMYNICSHKEVIIAYRSRDFSETLKHARHIDTYTEILQDSFPSKKYLFLKYSSLGTIWGIRDKIHLKGAEIEGRNNIFKNYISFYFFD